MKLRILEMNNSDKLKNKIIRYIDLRSIMHACRKEYQNLEVIFFYER